MKSDQPTIGRLLGRLRRQKKWTLREMSRRTGIPFSTLAKVEHDHLTLTYDKLLQLSERLEIPMSDLLVDTAEETEPAMARRSSGRIDQALRVKGHLQSLLALRTQP